MNRQIGELTNFVLSLTEKISSNIREGNDINVLSNEPSSRSDNWKHIESLLVEITECKLLIKEEMLFPENYLA